MWKQAIENSLTITKANIERFDGKFPHVSNGDGIYALNDNTDWTDGFWSGILWLSYEYSKDEAFREAAVQTVNSFRKRLENKKHLDHHDIGFLYSLSSKAQWILEQNEEAKALTLQAADVLVERWRESSQLIQAWGPEGDPANGGRIIIDCMMNLPLLYWAADHTGNAKYRDIAYIHAMKSLRFLVRGDDSSYHTFYFDQETGDSIRGGTHQGFRDGSTWTRGQAWGVYGFALAYRYFKDAKFLEASKRMARFFIERFPEDNVVYWDFDVPQSGDTKRDSSASAITACGILEILEHMDSQDPERAYFEDAVQKSMSSLATNYASTDSSEQGFIKRGSYSVRGGASPDDYVIWGDYYYLEALMRLEKGMPGYWYERGR
jgi:unsaturated chondroitin disaccharide hydrolase